MAVQDQVAKANIQSFIRHANILSEQKIDFDRSFLKSFNVQEECFNISRSYLGNDINYLQDAIGVRLYIKEVFGVDNLRLFEDNMGQIVLDLEHSLLFYYYMQAIKSPHINTALGLVYYLAGHQLGDELESISKVTTKGKISPKFKLDAKLFTWDRCPFILRKYMLQLSLVEGYRAYYFEKSNFTQIAYLIHSGIPFDNADAQLQSMSGGLFYPFLQPNIENALADNILSGNFDTSGMKGNMTQKFIADTNRISNEYQISDVYNTYVQMVKPIMVEVIGMLLNNMMEDASRNSYITKSDLRLYHVSPKRIGILVKDGLSLQSVLPTMHKFFKPVEQFDLRNIITGDFL